MTAGRSLVRRAAALLSAEEPLRETLGQLTRLFADVTGAAHVEYFLDEGQVARILPDGEPHLERDAEGCTVLLPIPARGKTAGVLRLHWNDPRACDDGDIAIFESCAVHLGSRLQEEAQRADRERLEHLASTDTLTGLENRRAFDDALTREWHRCARSRSPLGVLLVDVDFFKTYNDTYGHAAGDECLRRIAEAIGACTKRPGDRACRYGGEEFAAVVPETAPHEVAQLGEAICAAVRALEIEHKGSSLGYATVSVGSACTIPNAAGDPLHLLRQADIRLYRAKERGRNRVAGDSHLSDSPAAVRRVPKRHNLPAMRTPFLGRENEMQKLAALAEHSRLLTVTGPGGIGKTRLTTEYARRNRERYADGAWFVDLAALTGREFVAPTMLAAAGGREEQGTGIDAALVNHLRDKTALLVLDNCEHLVEEVARIVDRVLADCPDVCIVATSREVLEVDGEVVYRVSTFDQEEAVAFFASRAAAAAPSFSMTGENAETIRRICQRLDGLALAIELAAARVATMSVEELCDRLDDRFALLTAGNRTALPRQQTLHNLIDWSYELLPDSEKVLFRRLAIFAGGFSIDSAAAVCASPPLDEEAILELLARLIDKSLVQFDRANRRYWLLESTKAFALDRLGESGERHDLERLHALYHLSRASEAMAFIGSARYDDFRKEVNRSYADFRAALQWSLDENGDVAAGAELTAAIMAYWYEGGRWFEGRFWLERALSFDPSLIAPKTRARVLLALGNMYFSQGEFALMTDVAREAEASFAALGEVRDEARAKVTLANAALYSGRYEEAYEIQSQAMEAFRQVGDPRSEAIALNNLAELLAEWRCDFEQAERLYERAAAFFREHTHSYALAVCLGDWSQAAAYGGSPARAIELVLESIVIFRRIGDDVKYAEELIRLAQYRLKAGDADGAAANLREAIALLRVAPHPLYMARCADVAAELALANGRALEVATLLGFNDAWRKLKHLARPAPMESALMTVVAFARNALGDDEFARAWNAGGLLEAPNVLDLADSVLTPKVAV